VLQIVLQDVNRRTRSSPPSTKVKPGHPGEGAPHQRGLGRLQPDRAQRARRGRARGPRRRGYALERINNARGDVARFVNIYDEYRKAPTSRASASTSRPLSEVAAEDRPKLIIDSSMKGLLPLLNLDPIKQEAK